MKTQLENRYGESLYFLNSVGKSDIVAFKNQASSILSDKFYENRQEHMQDEAKRVITAATKLIKNEIRSIVDSKKEVYPSKREIANCECLETTL